MKKFNELCLKAYILKNKAIDLAKEEDGMGTIEVVLIAVALISLVVIFKSQVSKILETFISRIDGQAKDIFK